MRFRKLRIAFSATCLIPCALLIALWVRSYKLSERLHVQLAESRPIDFFSTCGAVTVLGGYDIASDNNYNPRTWRYYSFELNPQEISLGSRDNLIRFHFRLDWDDYGIQVPHWALMLFCIPVAAIPWLRWHFSLRTLLIATTLVAVVLGAIVYAAR